MFALVFENVSWCSLSILMTHIQACYRHAGLFLSNRLKNANKAMIFYSSRIDMEIYASAE